MSDINRVILTGNVGQEPETVNFDSGAVMTKLSLAVNKYDSKEKKEVTEWYTVKTFSKIGEYIKKGLKIAIDGHLQVDTWEKDGTKHKAVSVFAENIQILSKKEKADAQEPEVMFEDEEIPF